MIICWGKGLHIFTTCPLCPVFSASCMRAVLVCAFWGPLVLTQILLFLSILLDTKNHCGA